MSQKIDSDIVIVCDVWTGLEKESDKFSKFDSLYDKDLKKFTIHSKNAIQPLRIMFR